MILKKLMYTSDSIGLLVLRLVTGAIFIGHGLPKLGFLGGKGIAGATAAFAGWGIPLPALSATLVATTETLGGALLMLGFLTRVVTAAQAFAMLVAVFVVHWPNGFLGRGGYQWALLLAAAALCLMLDGAGRYSVDRKLGTA
jgi:putative oxidoreductase